jgi:hypothetical protein
MNRPSSPAVSWSLMAARPLSRAGRLSVHPASSDRKGGRYPTEPGAPGQTGHQPCQRSTRSVARGQQQRPQILFAPEQVADGGRRTRPELLQVVRGDPLFFSLYEAKRHPFDEITPLGAVRGSKGGELHDPAGGLVNVWSDLYNASLVQPGYQACEPQGEWRGICTECRSGGCS